jgi:hypothetical protein
MMKDLPEDQRLREIFTCSQVFGYSMRNDIGLACFDQPDASKIVLTFSISFSLMKW